MSQRLFTLTWNQSEHLRAEVHTIRERYDDWKGVATALGITAGTLLNFLNKRSNGTPAMAMRVAAVVRKSVDEVETTVVDVPAAKETTLIETILGVHGIAEQILVTNGLLGIARLSPIALAERTGITISEANRLAAAFELGRRMQASMVKRPKRLLTPKDVARFFAPQFSTILHEELWIAALGTRNQVRGVRMISRGGLVGAFVKPADVLRGALELGAIRLVMVHNHPSGDPTPSDDDIELTHAIEHSAHLIGVPLVDHVIVTPAGRYASVFKV